MISFWLLSIAINGIDALVLGDPQNAIQSNATEEASSLAAGAASMWYTNNTSTLSVAGVDEVLFVCDPMFGNDLNSTSCYDAVTNSGLDPRSTEPKTWGPRGTTVRYDFPIPQWFVSRTYNVRRNSHFIVPLAENISSLSEDGTCIFQAVIAPRRISAQASQTDVLLGATTLIDSCAEANPSTGGLAKQLGEGPASPSSLACVEERTDGSIRRPTRQIRCHISQR